MKAWGSVAAVVAAIRDDAAAEIERLERDHETTMAQFRSGAAIAPDVPDREPRLAAARARAASQDADDDWLDLESALLDREAWIARVVAQGRARLCGVTDATATRQWIAALAREGAACLPGDACRVVVSRVAAPLLDRAWCAELARATGKTIDVEPGDIEGGCVVRTSDGATLFDNSIDARLRRTETEWRGALAKLFELGGAERANGVARVEMV